MSAYLSPIGNEQQSDANGAPLSGGKIWTYVAGTTTPVATYTDSTGGTPQTNPIILNSAGLPANPIWLGGGQAVKMVFLKSDDSTARPTIDNIQGLNDPAFTGSADQWVSFSGTATFISGVSFSVVGDQTPTFQVNRRVLASVTAGQRYGVVATSVFAAGITTVTLTMDSGALDSGLSSVAVGLLSATNPSIPETATGKAVRIAADATAGRTALGGTATGGAVFTATDAPSARSAISAIALTDVQLGRIASLTASVAANALTATVAAGTYDFRSTTLPTGTPVSRTVASPISLTVPSGATLGTASGVASRLLVLMIDNAGTPEVAIVNASGMVTLDETGLVSTTAISAASGSASVIYSQAARSNVAYRVVGQIDSTQATAGTWASAPTEVQGLGGRAVPPSGMSYLSTVTMSGTSQDVTIPAGAKRITLMLNGVSTNGTSNIQVQIGSGSVTTAGYNCYNTRAAGGSVGTTNFTTGFAVTSNISTAADTQTGVMVLTNMGGSVWVCMSNVASTGYAANQMSAGGITLGGELDRIRLTTVGGADTFDAGTVRVIVE